MATDPLNPGPLPLINSIPITAWLAPINVTSTPAYTGPDDFTLADQALNGSFEFSDITAWFEDNPWSIAVIGVAVVLLFTGKRR